MTPGRLSLAFGLIATASLVTAGPCDIYAAGNTPCVAAHSTTRALYSAYSGSLYQVQRGSDNTTTDISTLSAGGVAHAAAQDSFCANTTCVITAIYDQSGRGNHLTPAPPGSNGAGYGANGHDLPASAIGAPVTLNGKAAYGVFISPGDGGYRIDNTNGVATGNEPEGMYAIMDGTHYNSYCCFDYGNAETNNDDDGAGNMEAVNLSGNPPAPRIRVDMENGLFVGSSNYSGADAQLPYPFVTAVAKGTDNLWSIRGGNAASGTLTTFYSGPRPTIKPGYKIMHKQGAIILGIGGDNSKNGQGTFYEGVMTTGYPANSTEDSVQADIVAAGYASGSLVSGPAIKVGSSVSFQVTTPGYTNRYIAHSGSTVNTQVVSASSPLALRQQASWNVVQGLGQSSCVSFESVDTPGSYIQQVKFNLQVTTHNKTKAYAEDATFCPQAGINGQGNTIRSWSYPTRFFRRYQNIAYAASNGGRQDFDDPVSFNDDVSFVVGASLA